MNHNPEFIKVLIDRGILTENDSLKLQNRYKGNHFAILLRMVKGIRGALATREDLGKIWGDTLGFPYIELAKTLIQSQVAQKLSEAHARKLQIIPIYQFGEGVTIATFDPKNENLWRKIETLINAPVSPVFTFPDEIQDAIEIHYQSGESLKKITRDLDEKFGINDYFIGGEKISISKLREMAGSDGIIELARGILLFAYKEKASDIHIEPEKNVSKIRFRIDGVLQEKLQLDPAIHRSLISRLKIMGKLDITERRLPQDGAISLTLDSGIIKFRLSSSPTLFGEKIVLRLLGQLAEKSILDIDELDFTHKILKQMTQLLKSPNGIFFVTGPTGSGKTTTLFSALKHLNKPDVNIMTIEDPVEYTLPGTNQVKVNQKIDLDFARALRCFLRQDPDIILVGEIRDFETARIAAQAALTGHLVLTSMHTNNSLQAITRLVEIGVEPFLVAPSIIGVLAQRLVRRLCEHCKEKYALIPQEIREIFQWDGEKEVFFYRAKGCLNCYQTGYQGRIGIHELFIVTDDIRSLIAQNASPNEIQSRAREKNFNTIRYDGIKKVLRGLTTMEEINQATVKESELLLF